MQCKKCGAATDVTGATVTIGKNIRLIKYICIIHHFLPI